MRIRTLIADDQELVRDGFAMILESEPGIEVVGEAADGEQAVAACIELQPDVVLMDVRMPVMDGIEATRQITARAASRILMLTTFDLDEYIYDAFQAGASGFLLKDARRPELIHAVGAVAHGDTLVAPAITRRLVEEFVRRPPTGGQPPQINGLTGREIEILALIGQGLSNSEMAAALFLSEATVKTHVSRILRKLNLRDRIQAVVLAYESGLIRPGV
jgi:DNA-binding NarL/FixJ family response regulator